MNINAHIVREPAGVSIAVEKFTKFFLKVMFLPVLSQISSCLYHFTTTIAFNFLCVSVLGLLLSLFVPQRVVLDGVLDELICILAFIITCFALYY